VIAATKALLVITRYADGGKAYIQLTFCLTGRLSESYSTVERWWISKGLREEPPETGYSLTLVAVSGATKSRVIISLLVNAVEIRPDWRFDW